MFRAVLVSLLIGVLAASCGGGASTKDGGPGTASLPSGKGGFYKVGNPYKIDGVRYVPREDTKYDQRGVASWYGPNFHGKKTANGETFDMYEVSAAHKTLPMPVMARVTNLENGKSVVLRVNDRGPFARGRIIDLSYRAAQLLDFVTQGTARVRVEYVGPASVGGGGRKPVQASAPPVRQLPPQPSTIYIQAGSFSDRNNAWRLKDELSSMGTTSVSNVTVNGREFYRVRVGPIRNINEADEVLARVVRAGQKNARIVVEDSR